MLTVNNLVGFGVGGGLDISYLSTVSSATNASSYTFAGVSSGGASKLIFCVSSTNSGYPLSISSVTFGGSAATLVSAVGGSVIGTVRNEQWVITAPAASGDLVVTASNNAGNCAVMLFTVNSAGATSAGSITNTVSSATSVSANAPATGLALVQCCMTTDNTLTWTGVVSIASVVVETTRRGVGSGEVVSGATVTATLGAAVNASINMSVWT